MRTDFLDLKIAQLDLARVKFFTLLLLPNPETEPKPTTFAITSPYLLLPIPFISSIWVQ
jgi:hypothetical protein